jgi:copper resistance protein D
VLVDPASVIVIDRTLHFVATMLLFGASAFVALLVRPPLSDALLHKLRSYLVTVSVLAFVSLGAMLPIQAAILTTGWAGAVDGQVLSDLAFGTEFGRVAMMRLLLAGGLIAIALRKQTTVGALAAISALLLASLSLSGHAAMHDGALGFAHRLNDAVHTLAAGAWLGALVPLAIVAKDLDGPMRNEAQSALRRFSFAGVWVVIAVIATGLLNLRLVLGFWPTTLSTPYVTLLALKILLVAVMIGTAIANRILSTPGCLVGDALAIHWLRRGIAVEILLGFGAVATVAAFGMLEPT